MGKGSKVLSSEDGRLLLLTGTVLIVGIGGWLWWWSARGADLESIERLVRRFFPSVPRISTEELAAWIAANQRSPVLLDVRGREEYEVSHLSNALHVDPSTSDAALETLLPKDTPIVTYCSVGYRSSAFAKRLRKAGYTDVRNLEGSAFRWANEGRPLERDGKPADKVHPYSNYWARLVKPERRAPLPN